MWENNGDNGQYGTTMALMLLPHWTDGCIASMEGLFFEASGTTPYHFVTAAAISSNSSNPVRELRYDDNDDVQGCAVSADARRQVLHGLHREGQGARPTSVTELTKLAIGRTVEHLSGRRQRSGRAAHCATGRRQPPRAATSASATSSWA